MFLKHSHTDKNVPKKLLGLLAVLLLLQSFLPVYAYFHKTQQSESFLIAICNTDKKILLTLNYGSEPSTPTLPSQEHTHCPVCVLPTYTDASLHLDTLAALVRANGNTIQYPATFSLTSIDHKTLYAIRAPPFSHSVS
ncbi:MAG: DUF2946 family protein [Gammaproteobacteria bacterium]|nr:DUF2946 family protein [Gammaproteobacteria bacterium]